MGALHLGEAIRPGFEDARAQQRKGHAAQLVADQCLGPNAQGRILFNSLRLCLSKIGCERMQSHIIKSIKVLRNNEKWPHLGVVTWGT